MTRIGATGEKNPIVSIASGLGVLVSGQLTTASGIGVTINSGVGLTVNSGVGVTIQSGAGVVLVSGLYVASGIYYASGVGVIINSGVGVTVQSGYGVVLVSGLYVASGIYYASGVGVIINSGVGVTIQSGTVVSGIGVTVNSGVGVNIGSAYVIMQSGTATVDIIVPGTPTINNSGNPMVMQSGLSGGWPLWSAACVSVTLKALSDNSGAIYIGGYTAGQSPYSGCGFKLEPGEAINMDVNNTGKVRVCNSISGSAVTYIAIAA